MEAPGILNFVGGIITLIGGLLAALLGTAFIGAEFIGSFVLALGIWGIIVGVILIASATRYTKSSQWSTIALIFSILGLVTLQGFVIGPLLGLIGSILMMTHKGKK